MSKRISEDQADMILWLLRERRFSVRQAADYVGTSTTTVYRISGGTWRAAPVEPGQQPELYQQQPPRRCGGCGAKITIWPCLACQIHQMSAGNGKTQQNESPS